MRPVLYRVAASLDGYIAGPRGEVDWIVGDVAADLAALYEGVDTVLLGRRTFELTLQPERRRGRRLALLVFSKTLPPERHAGVTVVNANAAETVAALRAGSAERSGLRRRRPFGAFLAARQVDAVEVAVMPVVLGGGVPPRDGAGTPPITPTRLAPRREGVP
jgi:dihydrofolate reductase